MERRHSLPLDNLESDEVDLNEIKNLITKRLPLRNRKISHNSQRYVSLSAIPEEMLTNDSKQTSEKTINDPAPDGGYGWVIVFASFFCNLTVDGICYTFGLFFNDFVDYFHSSKAVTALAGSLLSGCYLTSGVFVSGLTNRYGCRPITIVGSLISCLAFLISTVAPNSFVLLISYGVMAGIGFGLIYLPAIVTVGYYFTTKRAFATGIAVCGSGMGAFLFAPLCQWLLTIYDWQNALIILAGLILNCTVFGALMRPLNIEITEEIEDQTEDENPVLKNVDPGVNSNSNISHLGTGLINFDKSLAQSEILLTKNKIRSVSDSRSPHLDDLISPTLHTVHTHSSHKSIFVPPMSRKDVFYSGSTQNLKFGSNFDLHSVFTQLSDRKNSHKMSIKSDSNIYDKSVITDTKLDLQKSDDTEQSCSPICDLFDLSVMKETVMILLVVANIFGMTGYYIPFVYITQHARKCVKDGEDLVTPGKAALLLSAIGISNVCGRILFGWISDKISGKKINGKFRITALTINNYCLLMSGVVTIVIPLWNQYNILLIDCILFGLFISSYMSLTSIILVDLLGIETLSTTFGLISCFRGISSILGPPIAGALYDLTDSFTIVFICAGILLIISSIIHFFVAKYEKDF